MFFTKQTILNEIRKELDDILQRVLDKILENWVEGGHALTGSLEDTARIEIKQISNRVIGSIYLNSYYQAVNSGVPSENIPFNPGSGAQKNDYIAGLQLYWQLRGGLSRDEALSAAFATAHKHLQVGMPVDKGRLGFFTKSMTQTDATVNAGIDAMFTEILNKQINYFNNQTKGKIIIPL